MWVAAGGGGSDVAGVITAVGGLLAGTIGAIATLVIALRRSNSESRKQDARTVILVTDPEQARQLMERMSDDEH